MSDIKITDLALMVVGKAHHPIDPKVVRFAPIAKGDFLAIKLVAGGLIEGEVVSFDKEKITLDTSSKYHAEHKVFYFKDIEYVLWRGARENADY